MLKKTFPAVALVFYLLSSSFAAELVSIDLLPPDIKGGKTLTQSLQERKTSRSFSAKRLPMEVLSNLMWSACGINRIDSGKRTAPSARNWQEIDIYVAMEDGLYLYNAKAHVLEEVLKKDLRKNTVVFLQPSGRAIAKAPVQLIYVANYEKMSFDTNDEDKKYYSFADTGFIAQNVYLYCASAGLATGVRGMIDREALAKEMKLRDKQKITLVQAVGWPQ